MTPADGKERVALATPTRFVNAEAARARFGARVDTLASFLTKTDPLAEAVIAAFSEMPAGKGKKMLDLALERGVRAVPSAPRALTAFFAHAEEVPFWVDWHQLDVGGNAYLRCGVWGLFALGAGSLPLTYAPPAANKPLAFSKRLVEMAPRRLFDTMRFQLETCTPGGLRRGASGYKITLRVRLLHAQMRRVLLASGRWAGDAWGAPVNQADMAYANVLFSAYPLGWLERLGFHFTRDEADAVVQLWRYSGHLMGVDTTLLSATASEARRLGAIYESIQGPPDEDSRALTRALMDAAPALIMRYVPNPGFVSSVWLALARFMLGDSVLDSLGIAASSSRFTVPVVRAAIAQTEALRRVSPRGTELATRLGAAFERSIVAGGDHKAVPAAAQPKAIDAVFSAFARSLREAAGP